MSTLEPYEQTTAGNIPVLRWPALDATGTLDTVVTTRLGGVSAGPYESLNLGLHVGDDPAAVLENRRRAADAIGLELDDLVFCNQAHDRGVVVVDQQDRGRGARSHDDAFEGTDALVTTEPGIGLVVMVADCVPVVLVDPDIGVLSCVHAGWGGTTKKVTEAALATMVEYGADPSRVVAGIGPAIPADRYQVGEDVLDAATEAFGPAADKLIRPDGTGRWLFDLWAANYHILTTAGVRPNNIHLAALGSERDEFFSDRLVRPCGRFAALARLRNL